MLHQRIFTRARRLIPPTGFRAVQGQLRGRNGIEVGGPSAVFRRWHLWPLYPVVGALDSFNFATETIWSRPETAVCGLNGVTPRTPPGRDLVGEASEMTEIPSSAYDFLLASHVLEHVANPMKALHNWTRVVKPGGILVLIVPHRDGTFDHRRPITPLEHILSDFKKDIGEGDETHLSEIFELHDLNRDPGAGERAAFVERARNNIKHRSLHHHVFVTELALRLVDKAGLRIRYLDLELPYHICVVCSSPTTAPAPRDDSTENARYLSPLADWRRTSPFRSDRNP